VKGETSLNPLSLSLSNPRLPGTSPLGLASLNRKDLPIVVTLGGVGPCYSSLAFYFIAFGPSYKLCDNTLISKSNRPVNNFQSHIASQLAEHAAMYSASTVLRAILDCFLLCHEIMIDPKLKQHPEVLFLSAMLPAQSESVYPLNVKS
jgi:hypothetical protein